MDEQENPQTRLITDNIKLAYHVAWQFYKAGGVDPDELKAISLLGLVKAANSFDESKGYAFSSYATMCCQNEIRYYLRSWINQTGKNVSMATPLKDNTDEITLQETIEDETDIEEDVTTSIALRQILSELTDQERKIIEMRYLDHEYSQQYTAALLHIWQTQVSRIENRALKKMRELLG